MGKTSGTQVKAKITHQRFLIATCLCKRNSLEFEFRQVDCLLKKKSVQVYLEDIAGSKTTEIK